MRKRIPIRPVATTLRTVSSRRLPGSSGSTSVVGPVTSQKPGAPPRGDSSQVPSSPTVATTANGDSAMKSLQCWWRFAIASTFTASSGAPYSAVTSSWLVTRCSSMVLMLSPVGFVRRYGIASVLLSAMPSNSVATARMCVSSSATARASRRRGARRARRTTANVS